MYVKVRKIFEYILVFSLLLLLCFFVNNDIVIKALYMDDLYSWSWFPGLNLYEYAFKFYGGSRYRPVFDALQYLEYFFVQNKVFLFVIINKTLNAIIALFIYHFAEKLNAKRIIAFIVASMYVISHFSYYQIGQVIGLIETEAQFFALIILYFSFKLTGIIERKELNDNKKILRENVIITVYIILLYFIISFTHERYLSLLIVIVFSIFFAKEPKKKDKNRILSYRIKSYLFLFLTLLTICYIRYKAIGIVLPAGTGGTRVENTFDLNQCILFCFQQLLMIFGINIGPEHLVGIEFIKISNNTIKYLTFVSSSLLIVTFAISIVYKIYLIIKTDINDKFRLFVPDILFILFIAMCIGSSSVTIRVEMRFVYVSFTASLLYISYICGFLFNEFGKINKILSYIVINFMVLLSLSLRVPIELIYRDNYKNIHFFVDLDRVNSIYDNTIGKYGVDEILQNRTIYMTNNFFGFTDFYSEWFYKIYDTRNLSIEEKGTKIKLIKIDEILPEEASNENSILLKENIDNFREYIEIPIEK